MKGWGADGSEIELNPDQEEAVRALLSWDHGTQPVHLRGWGRGWGKTTVLLTVSRYVLARSTGLLLQDDPLMDALKERNRA